MEFVVLGYLAALLCVLLAAVAPVTIPIVVGLALVAFFGFAWVTK